MPKALVATIALEVARHEPILRLVPGLRTQAAVIHRHGESLRLEQPRHAFAVHDSCRIDEARPVHLVQQLDEPLLFCRLARRVVDTVPEVVAVDAEVHDRRRPQAEDPDHVAEDAVGGRGGEREDGRRTDRLHCRHTCGAAAPGGSKLRDPEGLLVGSGKHVRHVKVFTTKGIPREALVALLEQVL
jgi:hypothetical protein